MSRHGEKRASKHACKTGNKRGYTELEGLSKNGEQVRIGNEVRKLAIRNNMRPPASSLNRAARIRWGYKEQEYKPIPDKKTAEKENKPKETGYKWWL